MLPISAQTTEKETPLTEDEGTAIVNETAPAVIVVDTVPANAISTVLEQDSIDPEVIKGPALMNGINTYRACDTGSIRDPTFYPYKFMDDQTWVGIPVFLAGMIAKKEKEAFRQDYNNENTKIRLIKYNFHTEIDNYTQFSGIALTAGLKMAGWDMGEPLKSSASKHLNQWVLGGSLCVS